MSLVPDPVTASDRILTAIESRPAQIAPRDAARYDARFASRASSIVSSAMRDLMSLAERPEIISLAGGFPDTDSFPPEIFADVMGAVERDFVATALQYGPTEGLVELRERIADIMASEGAHARVEDIMVTSGGQQAIDLSIRTFVNPGDVVLAEGPTYPGAVPSLTTYEADVVHVPMDDDGLRVDLLEETLDRLAAEGRRVKLLYTIPNFHNPAGVTMSLERRERLVALAHERELIVVEDNPYGQIRFEGEPLPTLYQLDDGDGWVIYCSTFSKILAPGIRVGWVVAPAPVLRKMNLGKQGADLCSSTLTQRFILEYLRRYDWRDHVARLNGIYRSRRDAMLDALDREFPGEATWTRPRGGLFVWATLPSYIDTTDLFARAVTREVAFVPGEAAFRDGRGRHSMRLNFSYVEEGTIAEGVRRLGDVIGDLIEDYRALNPGPA
ncbi:MAG: PLP-dependent aminotransferase family protein [Actinomycetota bacterium]